MNSALLVATNPTTSDVEEEYHRWYDEHLAEVLEVPGMLVATRYACSDIPFGDRPKAADRWFLTVYEIEGPDPQRPTMDEMRRKSRTGDWRGNTTEGVETVNQSVPAWNLVLEPHSASRPSMTLDNMHALLLVGRQFSWPLDERDYDAWSARHADEVLGISGFVAVTQFVKSPGQFELHIAEVHQTHRFFTLYELDAADPTAVSEALAEAVAVGAFTRERHRRRRHGRAVPDPQKPPQGNVVAWRTAFAQTQTGPLSS